MKRGALWLWLGLAASALAQAPLAAIEDRINAERERLQAERTLIEQAHEARTRECWQRFAVNSCLQQVRRDRHAALDPLRARELALNEQERAWRTQQREQRLREKDERGATQP